jgi:elongator complex protein 3
MQPPPHRADLRSAPNFDPAPHREALLAIIDEVMRAPALDARGLDRIVKRHPRSGRGLFSKTEIIAGFRAFGAGVSEAAFLERLRLRPVRTLSGVTPVTVLTKPFPCPGTCIFCPNDVRMPKSYLADEPGAQRAEDNRFDPYLQTWNRLDAYRSMGHPTDKVELIVLGGTWSHYPEAYQRWFVRRCFEALCDFGEGIDGRGDAGAAAARYRQIAALHGNALGEGAYNRAVSRHLAEENAGELLHGSETSSWAALESAQRRNEDAAARCVGLVLETRPDRIDAAELRRLRRLGATKVQLGVQSLDDVVLAANRRGHDVAATRRAFLALRAAGFKIHAHWMPNLLGADPAADAADYRRLFDDPDFRPDELKLYPCMLIESAELAVHHERGAWRAYDDETLVDLVAGCIEATPRWCRLTRVIRDFSAHDVAAGTHTANLREVAERALAARGVRAREIRSREVRDRVTASDARHLRDTVYAHSAGEERFLEWVTADDRLAGFLRLTLPTTDAPWPELDGCALIREVHVYGASLPLGDRAESAAQHVGLGRALVAEAARRARDAGYPKLAVISAVGTRPYYRRLGFADGELYMHRALDGRLPDTG